jgi:hypothetical protein
MTKLLIVWALCLNHNREKSRLKNQKIRKKHLFHQEIRPMAARSLSQPALVENSLRGRLAP